MGTATIMLRSPRDARSLKQFDAQGNDQKDFFLVFKLVTKYAKPPFFVANSRLLMSLSEFCGERLSFVAISFYVLSLLFGSCRLSEFTLAGPLC